MALLLNGVFSLVLEGYILSTGSPGTNVWTTVTCADRCLADSSCVAFFHHKKSGLCQLSYNRDLSNEQLTQVIGVRFYVLYKESCPLDKGYRLFTDQLMCVRIGLEKIDHAHAMISCQNDGGFLIRIDSQQKQDLAAQLHQEISDSPETWIDGSDEDVEDVWRFSNGTLMTYTHWSDGEPNNDGNCVRLRKSESKWFDKACNYEFTYICELPIE